MKLLITLFFCHWLADYTPLSTTWMLRAKKFGTPIWPIGAHAAVQAAAMGFGMLFFAMPITMWTRLVALQFATHWLIDIGKGRATKHWTILQDITKPPFWVLMGFDQFLHQLVIIFMAWQSATISGVVQ